MKKTTYTIIIFLLVFTGMLNQTAAQSVTNDFEDGNWLYYNNLCWGISPNNPDFTTKVTGNGFNGSKVCETGNLGQQSPCTLTSPWIMMNGGDVITFDHSLTAFNGTRTLKVYLVSFPSMAEELVLTYNYSDGKAHNEKIVHAKTGNYKVKWQWTGTGGNSIGQVDNIAIGGTYNSDPSNNCQPLPDPVADADLDGVPDSQDAYPSDKYRAYNSHYPASDTSTLIFEDLWPYYGDYDLNDLVVGYKFRVVSNSMQQVVEVFGTFVLKASGASIRSGFGFTLPNVDASSVIESDGYDLAPGSGYELGPNGTENGQKWATFIIFDKAKRFIPLGNTISGNQANPYHRFNLHFTFMENGNPGPGGPVKVSTLNIQGFNPFLVSGNSRGKEVHLPGYPPTSLADMSLLGTGKDHSNPATGKYYQSETNLPWALDICSDFAYPEEKISVMDCYNKFAEWVQSSGSQYPDWYLDKPGYRESQKIYQFPL